METYEDRTGQRAIWNFTVYAAPLKACRDHPAGHSQRKRYAGLCWFSVKTGRIHQVHEKRRAFYQSAERNIYLVQLGGLTIEASKEILKKQRDLLAGSMKEMQLTLDLPDQKIEYYENTLQKKKRQ